MIPGEYFLANQPIEINKGRKTETVVVINTGDRPVQIGSHFHFFEINKQLVFARGKGYGMRLNIVAGTAVRFEPGEEKEVELVQFGGAGKIVGFSNLVAGVAGETQKEKALRKAEAQNFKSS